MDPNDEALMYPSLAFGDDLMQIFNELLNKSTADIKQHIKQLLDALEHAHQQLPKRHRGGENRAWTNLKTHLRMQRFANAIDLCTELQNCAVRMANGKSA